jgi:pimeloyl-ACP methyl ester carboxylesterase
VVPETKYAKSGNLHIAYQVVGKGPPDLVFVHGWISHIEHLWEEPGVARFLDRLASFSRLILLDKRGTGLSDPVPLDKLPTLEERIDDVRVVMDAAESKQAALLGTSEAGALNLLFAAMYPERTTALILLNSYARLAWAHDYVWGIPANTAGDLLKGIEEGWGKGVAFEALMASQLNNAPMRDWWARYQRLAASPGAAVELLRRAYETDTRPVLSNISAPTLILHRAGDPFTGPEHSRYLANRILHAQYVELSGVDHLFFAEGSDRILVEIQKFLAETPEVPKRQRALTTILFADIVGSAEQAAKLGSRQWQDLLNTYRGIVRSHLATYRGREIRTVESGVLATFDGPVRAIRCACEIRKAIQRLGIAVRIGVHIGECEVSGSKMEGAAVDIGTRVAAAAGPNEIFVSNIVKDLAAGSGLRFEPRGGEALKDFPGEWILFAVHAD